MASTLARLNWRAHEGGAGALTERGGVLFEAAPSGRLAATFVPEQVGAYDLWVTGIDGEEVEDGWPEERAFVLQVFEDRGTTVLVDEDGLHVPADVRPGEVLRIRVDRSSECHGEGSFVSLQFWTQHAWEHGWDGPAGACYNWNQVQIDPTEPGLYEGSLAIPYATGAAQMSLTIQRYGDTRDDDCWEPLSHHVGDSNDPTDDVSLPVCLYGDCDAPSFCESVEL